MIEPLPLIKVYSDFIIHINIHFLYNTGNVLGNDRLVYLKTVISSVCSYKQNLRAYQPKIIIVEQNSLSKGKIRNLNVT